MLPWPAVHLSGNNYNGNGFVKKENDLSQERAIPPHLTPLFSFFFLSFFLLFGVAIAYIKLILVLKTASTTANHLRITRSPCCPN